MTTPVTLEDIYRIFERSQAEADRRFAEADRRLGELEQLFADSKQEADRRLGELEQLFADSKQEADRRAAEADRRFGELEQLFADSKQDADRRAAEADRRLSELERFLFESQQEFDRRMAEMRQENQESIREMRRMVAGLSDRWGSFVENLVKSSAIAVFEARGMNFTSVYRGLGGRYGDFQMEVDVLVANDTEVVVIEVKSHLTQEEVEDFLTRLPRFKAVLPFYKDHRVYGAVAGIDIDQGVDRYAYRQGLFVLQQAGEFVKIANDDRFQPLTW
ncbi:MAG: DUF3782 domain-containing protein [Prochlorothrix sp.]